MWIFDGTWWSKRKQLCSYYSHKNKMWELNGCGKMFRCVTSIFYDAIYQQESVGHLNVLNGVSIYYIYEVYLKKINHALRSFSE